MLIQHYLNLKRIDYMHSGPDFKLNQMSSLDWLKKRFNGLVQRWLKKEFTELMYIYIYQDMDRNGLYITSFILYSASSQLYRNMTIEMEDIYFNVQKRLLLMWPEQDYIRMIKTIMMIVSLSH